MRKPISAVAATAGSFAFQMGLSFGYLKNAAWTIPWAWAVCISLWFYWAISFEKLTVWLQVRLGNSGKYIATLQVLLCLLVFVFIGVVFQPMFMVKAEAKRTSPQTLSTDQNVGSIKQDGTGNTTIIGNGNSITTPRSPRPSSNRPKPKVKKETQTTQKAEGDSNIQVAGNINQGPCSSLQIGTKDSQATAGTCVEPPYGNLKKRTSFLSRQILDDLYQHGWPLPYGVKVPEGYVIEKQPTTGKEDEDRHWTHFRSGTFRFKSLKGLIQIQKELADVHLHDDYLDGFIEDETSYENLYGPDFTLWPPIFPQQLQHISEILERLADEIPTSTK
jgi:hypothetical protein